MQRRSLSHAVHIHPAPGHCGAGSWKALRAWHGTRHIRTPKCWFPSYPPVSQGEKPNQHGVVTGVGTDQGLPKKGQSQSGGRTPPLWQAAGAEPGRLESLRSQREGYRRRRQQSEQTQGGSGCLASCPGGERVGRGGGGAAELGCGRSYWHHVASDFYFRGTDMHSAEWTFVTFAGPSSNLPLPSAP